MRKLLFVWLIAGCGDVEKLQLDAKVPMCGDSVVDPGEACDTGGESATCNDDCTTARCGDMKVNAAASEACDDGNTNNGDGCSNTCELTTAFPSNGSEGAFAPTTDVTITGGVHQYTTITIPAGVTVTVDNGVAELRATGAVTIDGTINVSGGKGADVANDAARYEAGGGGGGKTGNPTEGVSSGAGCVPAPADGGFGSPGAVGGLAATTEPCTNWGGAFGGGNGGGRCNGAGGGGGFAGGGGGAGYTSGGPGGAGGVGASASGGIGGGGGVAGATPDGVGKTAGGGGAGVGNYAGRPGIYTASNCGGSYPGTSGGGGAIGALAQSDLAVATTFQPGSGGGGGGGQCLPGFYGGAGGGGAGGALRISSPVSITVGAMGSLLANGGAGGNGIAAVAGAGAGGGGSGGVIYLSAPVLNVRAGATISAIGGAGGTATPANCGFGGAGGLGRIRISATQSTCSLDGLFNPSLNAAGCAPSSVAEKVYVAPYPN